MKQDTKLVIIFKKHQYSKEELKPSYIGKAKINDKEVNISKIKFGSNPKLHVFE